MRDFPVSCEVIRDEPLARVSAFPGSGLGRDEACEVLRVGLSDLEMVKEFCSGFGREIPSPVKLGGCVESWLYYAVGDLAAVVEVFPHWVDVTFIRH